MKDTFDGFLSSLDMAKERISQLEDMTIATFKIEKQREKRTQKENRISKNCRRITKGGNIRRRKREKNRSDI